MEFGRRSFFRKFAGKGRTGKWMGTGKTKGKMSQGDLIVRGEYFTCPGMQCRFSRPVRRFFRRRCIRCALKFNSPDDQEEHLHVIHDDSRVCSACFQSYRMRVDLFSAHHFRVPVSFKVIPLGRSYCL